MISEELLALQDADELINKFRRALYRSDSVLPQDALTQAAFGALCGAARYIERLTREHVTGER